MGCAAATAHPSPRSQIAVKWKASQKWVILPRSGAPSAKSAMKLRAVEIGPNSRLGRLSGALRGWVRTGESSHNQKTPLQGVTSALSPIWTMAVLHRTIEVGAQRLSIRKLPDRGFGSSSALLIA